MQDKIKTEFEKQKDVWKTAEALNVDAEIVRYHLRKAGVKLPKGSYKQRAANKSMTAPISQLHAAIGAKIGYLRMNANMADPSEFAHAIGLSTKKYGNIERGQSDATISDLNRIARGFSTTIHDLLTPLNLKH